MKASLIEKAELLALIVTLVNEQERVQVEELAAKVQKATGSNVKIEFYDQDYTGENSVEVAKSNGIELVVVKLRRRIRA
jgi:spermidine/putrescine-binding protein